MVVRKGLSKAFTREVISEDTLAPSEFKVIPVKLSRSYADSPIEELRKQKQMESSFEEDKAAEERLRKARVPTETLLDRDKINRVVQRLNTFKKMRLEQEKQQAAEQVQKVNQQTQKQATEQGGKANQQAQKISPAPPLTPPQKIQAPQKQELPVKKQENQPPAQKQENSPPTNKSSEPKKPDSLTKNKKDNSIKEPSF